MLPSVQRGPVMVVEDSPEDFEALCRAFRKLSVTMPIKHFESGDAAIAELDLAWQSGSTSGAAPSLILLDLNLPGTDGREVLHIIKSRPELRHIPVLIFTTSRDERDVRDCYNAGANCYVQKPVDMTELVDTLRHLVEFWFATAILPETAR